MATRRIRQSMIGGAVTAATALAVLSAAPSASAQVTSVSAGTALAHVGTSYTLTAHVGGTNPGSQVGFWIADSNGGKTYLGASAVDSSSNASLAWTPTAAGSFNILANDDLTAGATGATSIGISVTSVPAGQLGTGSASKIPIIGPVLSGLLAALGLS